MASHRLDGGCCSRIRKTSFHPTLADQKNNNNITGFKNKRVDELSTQYDIEFDSAEARRSSSRRSTASSPTQHHYILEWDAPFQRIATGTSSAIPQGYLTRIGDYRDMPSLWWIDPQKEQQLAAAMSDPSVKLAMGRDRRCATGSSTAKREDAAAGGQPPMTAISSGGLLLDHPDLHRDHARRVRRSCTSCRAGRSSGRSCATRWRR